MQAECTTSVWDIINIISSILGIISAVVTIVAAFRVKRYANSIVQAYSSESLVIANEKIDQAKELYLQLRSTEFGKARGSSSKRTQEELSSIESLLDEAEKKTPSDKVWIKDSIKECKKSLNKCVTRPTEHNVFLHLGSDLDNVRKQYQNTIEEERNITIKNLK